MTPTHFDNMSLEDRMDFLEICGTVSLVRCTTNQSVYLYSVDDFWVEVFVNPNNKTVAAKTIAADEIFKLYGHLISIEELLS